MTNPDLALLRLHVEAVWYLSLPDLHTSDNDLLEAVQPPWSLYLACLTDGQRIGLWKADVAASAREDLIGRAEAALALPADEAVEDKRISREVALIQRDSPRLDSEIARMIARRLTTEDAALLDGFADQPAEHYLSEERAPLFGVMEEDRLVCLAHSARKRDHVCELGIDTLPAARRRGYALAATLLWADAVATEGREPFYSALAENTASLALAHAAGFRPFAYGVSLSS